MESDYSDLTDLDDFEEDADYGKGKKTKTSKTGKGAAAGGYRIRHALKVPRATTYTAQALYDQIHSSDINLEPEYQRAVVWPESKQIGLIDSVFRNFYIPPVIFAVTPYEDGSESKTCIDGKQRLTSIHRFMDGLIPHRDPHTGEKLWYKDASPPGATTKTRKKLLPEKYRRLFSNKQIVCVEYADITSSDEREIFQRVQLGMALTPAEKLQVINTSRASYVRDLLKDYVDDEERGLAGDDLDWDRSRGADFRCLAQSVHLITKWKEVTTVASIPQLEKWLSSSEPLEDALQQRIRDVYDLFRDLVHDAKLNKVFKKPTKISPVEFVIIPVLISACGERMGMAQLSAAIGKMRDEVRKAHVDIRMNSRVSKWMLEYVEKLAEGTKGKVRDGLSAMAEKRAAAAASGGGAGKRKRQEVDDDSGSEAEYKPRKTGNPGSNSNNTEQSNGKIAAPPVPAPAPKKDPASTSTTSSTPTTSSRRVDRLAAVRMAKEMAANTRNISANAAANGSSNAPSANTPTNMNTSNTSTTTNTTHTSSSQVPPHPMQQPTASQMMPTPMPRYTPPLPMSPNPQAMSIPIPMMPPGVLNSSLISQLWGQFQQQPMAAFNPALMPLQPQASKSPDSAPPPSQHQQPHQSQQQSQPQWQPNAPQTHPLPPHPQQGEYRYGPNVSSNANPPRRPRSSTGGGQQGHFKGPVDSGWGSRGGGGGGGGGR
ncbi:hypothetical protein BDN71DRAFT_1450823 [Pleurotus eryngii]|uniref:GmrSD restriction endonucleases N-terminal domain-containing protein n=1 Tax=Pleurotus eryngii TaxID=5323 RepID=A0A9P6DEY1_PLEER|nr:hypothetical protein BDN71DRAFT_1450823 [Pleurotus eryngii]